MVTQDENCKTNITRELGPYMHSVEIAKLYSCITN